MVFLQHPESCSINPTVHGEWVREEQGQFSSNETEINCDKPAHTWKNTKISVDCKGDTSEGQAAFTLLYSACSEVLPRRAELMRSLAFKPEGWGRNMCLYLSIFFVQLVTLNLSNSKLLFSLKEWE